MATKRFKSNKLLVEQLINKITESDYSDTFVVGERSKPSEGIYRLHYDGKVHDILTDVLSPFEDPKFLSDFIPSPDEDHMDLHFTIEYRVGQSFEIMVWDYNLGYKIRHVFVPVKDTDVKGCLSNYVPLKEKTHG